MPKKLNGITQKIMYDFFLVWGQHVGKSEGADEPRDCKLDISNLEFSFFARAYFKCMS
jgi:hypothetical protein